MTEREAVIAQVVDEMRTYADMLHDNGMGHYPGFVKRQRDWADRLAALPAPETAQQEKDALLKLRERLDAKWDGDERAISFASVMDQIDSQHLRDVIYDLVIWHIRRADSAQQEIARLREALKVIESLARKLAHIKHGNGQVNVDLSMQEIADGAQAAIQEPK